MEVEVSYKFFSVEAGEVKSTTPENALMSILALFHDVGGLGTLKYLVKSETNWFQSL